jgi:hypothetical protein
MYVLPVAFTGSPFSIARINALRSGDRVDLLYTKVDVPSGLEAQQREDVRANPIPFLQTRIMLTRLRSIETAMSKWCCARQPTRTRPTRTW